MERVEQFFLRKQHLRGPLSANLIKLDREKNVHIVEGSSLTRLTSHEELPGGHYDPLATLKS